MRDLDDWAWGKGFLAGGAVAGFLFGVKFAAPDAFHGLSPYTSSQVWNFILAAAWAMVWLLVAFLADRRAPA